MQKRLTKSSTNRVISGVLGGIAEYLGIDATVIRVIYVILSIGTCVFPGFTLYIVLMIIMPSSRRGRDRHYDDYESPYEYHKKNRGRKEVEKLDPEDDDWSDF